MSKQGPTTTESPAAAPFEGGANHLRAELSWLTMLLLREVARLRLSRQRAPDGFQGLYIDDDSVDRMLLRSLGWSTDGADPAGTVETLGLQAQERRVELDARIAATEATHELPLVRLARRCGLNGFDVGLLVLACAADLDAQYETLYAYLQNDVTRRRPTVGLALSLLGGNDDPLVQRQRLAAAAPLSTARLLDVSLELPFLSRPLRVDDRVLDYLLEAPGAVDYRLRPFVSLDGAPSCHERALPDALNQRLDRLRELFASKDTHRLVPIFEAGYGGGAEAAAAHLAATLGRPLLHVDIDGLPAPASAPEGLTELIRREATLTDALLLLEHADLLTGEEPRASELRRFIEPLLSRPEGPTVLVTAAPLARNRLARGLQLLPLTFPLPDYEERPALWSEAVDGAELLAEEDDLRRIAGTFSLSRGSIADAAAAARLTAALRGSPGIANLSDLQTAAREQSHHDLGTLARRVETRQGWSDLVLPQATLRQLQEIVAAVQTRQLVYGEWRLGSRFANGRGVNALFSGASGTGKTMSAGVIAAELGLDLYAIDLATIVSKYIGETEKNLRQIFAEAQSSNAVLFFDEADALFGKRSEVKDAHDRYANIEVAYLLQLMESYEGIAILATNLSKNVDDAFARRIQYAVEFPFPAEAMRAAIWRQIFPAEVPLADDVDFAYLARQFELAGGSIKGAAIVAAVLGAADGERVEMRHLTLAVAREYQKLGKLPSQGEFGPYYSQVMEHIGGR